MKPDNIVRIVENTRFLQRLDVAPVTLYALGVVRLEYAENIAVSQRNQIVGDKVTAFTVVHLDLRLVFHLLQACLDKYIGNPKLFQTLVKRDVLAKNFALAGFDNQPFDVFLQKLLQTPGLRFSGIAGVLKEDAVALLCHNAVNPLDDLRKNIVRQIGCHHSNIPGSLGMAYKF